MQHSRWAPEAQDTQVAKEKNAEKPKARDTAIESPATVPPPPPSSSLLSAAATTFSPVSSSTDDSTIEPSSQTDEPAIPIDEFAQTGGGEDDLFDDAVLSDDESMRVRDDDDLFNDEFTPAPTQETTVAIETQPIQEVTHVHRTGEPSFHPREGPASTSSRVNNRSRARGGRGKIAHTPRHDQRASAQPSSNPNDKSTTPSDPDPPENAPTGPKKESVPAVRGDRQATGGVKRPKLTEEELAEKMAQIQIKNASLVAAHARAEADAASFAERENQARIDAAQRQKVERRDRQQMMGEREKNRQRKLKAMDGREWDAEKNEDDFGKGGRFDRKGGFVGDQPDYSDGREYLYREPRGGGTPRGGRRGGRGGQTESPKSPPTKDDFPALPSTKAPVNLTGSISSWADQVENA